MKTQLPLAIVESSSMDHHLIANSQGYEICGTINQEKAFLNKEEYWKTCGKWYEDNFNITKEQFSNFKFSNGFSKGDLIIIYGKRTIDIGDVIIFQTNRAHPIIHRVVSEPPTLQTKGDHNSEQISFEKSISNKQILGKSIIRIPLIGWVKLIFYEPFRAESERGLCRV